MNVADRCSPSHRFVIFTGPALVLFITAIQGVGDDFNDPSDSPAGYRRVNAVLENVSV